MSYYQVKQAAASVVAEDGSRSLLYFGDVFEAGAADKDHLKMLLDEGFVDQVEVAEPESDEPKPGTADYILAEVGDDAEKAQAALDEENAKPKPRKGLVTSLEAIVGGQS